MAEINTTIVKVGKFLSIQMGVRPDMFTARKNTIVNSRMYMFPKDNFIPVRGTKLNSSTPSKQPDRPPWKQGEVKRYVSLITSAYCSTFIKRPTGLTLNDKALNTFADSNSRHLDFTDRNGIGKIQNTVLIDNYPTNLPASAEVMVIRLSDKKVMGRTFTNSTNGQYVVKGLNPSDKYLTIAFDIDGVFKPVLDSNVKPI